VLAAYVFHSLSSSLFIAFSFACTNQFFHTIPHHYMSKEFLPLAATFLKKV